VTPEQATRLKVTKELARQRLREHCPSLLVQLKNWPLEWRMNLKRSSVKFSVTPFTLWTASRSLFIMNGKQPILRPCQKLFLYMTAVTRSEWKISWLEKERLGTSSFHATSDT
jgi:hypothetical protein